MRRANSFDGVWFLIAAGLLINPVFWFVGKDAFRNPKDLLFRAEVIAIVAALLWEALARVPQFRFDREWRSPASILCLMTVAWTAVAAMAATNRPLAMSALLSAAGFALYFLVVAAKAGDKALSSIHYVLLPAVINAAVAVLQETGIWNPFRLAAELGRHARTVAFLGNPDYVGAFLVAPLIAAVVLTLVRPERRVVYASTAAVLAAGLLASESFTAVIAAGAGLTALLFVVRRRAIAVVALMAIGAAVFAYAPVRNRILQTVDLARNGEFDVALSGRMGPFLATWMMFADHPAAGVGPGCFPYQFFRYRTEAQRRHGPQLRLDVGGLNFGEAHNDQLQVLAETGLPGYALFLAVLVVIVRTAARRGTRSDDRQQFARFLALPLVVSFFVLTLGQFPMHLTPAIMVDLFLAAIVMAWSAKP